MSENNIQTDNTVNNQQHEEVDYADPESPTLAIRQFASPTTGTAEHLIDVVKTDNTADTANTLLPGSAPTLTTDEAPTTTTTSLPSATSKEGCRTSNDDEVMVYSLNHPPMKRRRLDMGDLMVKTTGPAKPISDKPVEQYRTV